MIVKKIKDKIVNTKTLIDEIKEKSNKKVILTNECFDIIYNGHVNYLEKGDILIVGLNSDSSIKKLKGENRPILPEACRMALLAALESVDYVIVFDDDTPFELINTIRPDIYIKGGDYNLDNMLENNIGFKKISVYCKDAKIIQFEDSISTTQIV